MCSSQRFHKLQSGFLVVFVAVALAAAAATFLAANVKRASNSALNSATGLSLNLLEAQRALRIFVGMYKRLPCPAAGNGGTTANPAASTGLEEFDTSTQNCRATTTNGTNVADGVLPWQTLGLPESVSLDPWGTRISYRPYTDPNDGLTRGALSGNPAGMDGTLCVTDGVTGSVGTGDDNCLNTASSLGTNTSVQALSLTSFINTKGLRLATGVDTLQSAPNSGEGAAYVLISHGPNRSGGYNRFGSTNSFTFPSGSLEAPNGALATTTTSNTITVTSPTSSDGGRLSGSYAFVNAALNTANATGDYAAPYFDDIVAYENIRPLLNNAGTKDRGAAGMKSVRLDTAGTAGQVARIDATSATGSSVAATATSSAVVINFGSSTSVTDAGESSVLSAATVNTNTCAWFNNAVTLNNNSLRLGIYGRFKLFPGESVLNTTANVSGGGTGGGFVITLMPGTGLTTSCGTTTGNNASRDLGYVGIDPDGGGTTYTTASKIGIEFDLFDQGNDPGGNHVAVITGNSITHPGTGSPPTLGLVPTTSNTAYCQRGTAITTATGMANGAGPTGTSAVGCTWRPREPVWMEGRLRAPTATTGTINLAAAAAPAQSSSQPAEVPVRIDIQRRCSYSTATNTCDCSTTGNFMDIKAWVGCTDAACHVLSRSGTSQGLNTQPSLTISAGVTAVAPTGTNSGYFQISSGDFANAGFKVGDNITITGLGTTANNRDYTIAALGSTTGLTTDPTRRLYVAYRSNTDQAITAIGVAESATFTKLVNTLNYCVLEPRATGGTPITTDFDTIRLGITMATERSATDRLPIALQVRDFRYGVH